MTQTTQDTSTFPYDLLIYPYMLTSGVKLIGIRGYAGAGKDTVADYIISKQDNTWKASFAEPLKNSCAAAFGIPLDDFFNQDKKEILNEFWGVTPRQIAQFVGSEVYRDLIAVALLKMAQGDFWLKRMFGYLNNNIKHEFADGTFSEDFYSHDTVVIPDVRFQNEYDFIINNGGLMIHLTRPGADGNIGIQSHISEAGIKTLSTSEYSIHNSSTLEHLHEAVDKLLTYNSL
jgi:hypothetical protein